MHFPYIVYCQYAPLRFILLSVAESISVCAMHVIYYVLHQSYETWMLERVSKKRERERARETELVKWGERGVKENEH